MQDAIGPGGDGVLFGDEFDAVGEGLEQTERTRASRPQAILHSGRDFAFAPDEEKRGDADKRDDQPRRYGRSGDQGQPSREIRGEDVTHDGESLQRQLRNWKRAEFCRRDRDNFGKVQIESIGVVEN